MAARRLALAPIAWQRSVQLSSSCHPVCRQSRGSNWPSNDWGDIHDDNSVPGQARQRPGYVFTGQQSMEFRLYAVPTGGVPLWTEYWTGGNSVSVSDGLFSVLLGSLTTNPMLASVVQANTQLWLGITIGTDTEMTPRVQLGSAAYSMQALSVPDASIESAKLADQSVTGAKIAAGAIDATKIQSGNVGTAALADAGRHWRKDPH